jgi:hypothetical protein
MELQAAEVHEARNGDRDGSGRRVTKSPRLNPAHQEGSADPVQEEYASLVRSAAAGDIEALDRLLLRAQEVAWRFSTSVCGHTNDAEDAMQEALIKTYRYVGRIREPEAFRPWLYRTVRNACLMGRRKKAGEPTRLHSLDEVLPGPIVGRVPMHRIPGRTRSSWRTTPRSVAGCEKRSTRCPQPTEPLSSCARWKACRREKWRR